VITANPTTDPLVTYVYGGDNQGNMWRFDFTQPGQPPAPLLMGSAAVGSVVQPITSRPEVTMCAVTATDANKNKSTVAQRVVAFGTGRLLDTPDLTNVDKQSVYVLKDSGSAIAASNWRGANMAQRTLTDTGNKNTHSYTIGGTGVDLGSQAGWYLDLDQNSGERVNLDPKVVAGTLTVVSNIPSSSSACQIGGTSNVYQLDVCTGAAVAVDNSAGSSTSGGTTGGTSGGTGGGTAGGATGGTSNSTTLIAGHTLSSSSAAVGYIIVRLPSGALKMITTFADGSTATSSVVPAKAIEAHRAGWRRVRE
jgi:type IV pilus assembly protein PilY1